MSEAPLAVVTVRRYLAGAAPSAALFKILVDDAVSLLPPPGTTSELERLECRLTITKMASMLGVSRTTIQRDLRRLENYRWVETNGAANRFLGQRRGRVLNLIADFEARRVTGVKRLVSERVLRLKKEAASAPKPKGFGGSGVARRWVPYEEIPYDDA